jgi:hypothetical protein
VHFAQIWIDAPPEPPTRLGVSWSHMSRGVLVLWIAVLSLLANVVAAAPLGGPDRRARVQAQVLLERARSADHRRLYRIVVPATPSGLPERYSIRHHANFIAFVEASRVIDVERDADGARVELLDPEGLARAPLPAAEVDALVRLAFYLHHARAEARDDSFGMSGFGYASHTASRQVHIEGEGLSLTTTYAQPIMDTIDGQELEQFVLTQLATRLEALVDANVGPAHRVLLDEDLLADAERRLRAIPRGPTPLSQYDRDDRDAVVARLLGRQLVTARVEHAVPLLLRKGLDEQAYALALATTADEDLPHALPGLLCSDEYDIHEPAFAFAVEHRERSREALRHALGCRLSEDKVVRILRELAKTPPAAGERLTELRSRLSDTRSPAIRLEAARALWVLERDAGAQRLLRSLAVGGGRRQGIQDLQLDALHAIAAAIDRKGRERRVVAELALEILRGVPLDQSGERLSVAVVLEKVGQYGDAEDVDSLVPWLDHTDAGLVGDAVEVVERLDPERALAEARERLQGYVRGVGRADYAHAVAPFAQLLVRQDDRDALADLRAAAVPLRAEAPAASDPRRRAHAAFVAYLEAAPARRAKAALAWVELTPELEHSTYTVLRERHPTLDEATLDHAQAVARGDVEPD